MPRKNIDIDPELEPIQTQPNCWKIEHLGVELPDVHLDTALLYGFYWSQEPAQKEYFFWRIAAEWWNTDPNNHMFARHKWSISMVRNFCTHKYAGVGGAASCVAGDTRLLNPLTGELPTIQSLCESNTRPWVQTLNGPVLADVPYLKGTKELFEFKLSNGESFRCTADHRLLTPSGWQNASQTTVGAMLFGYAPSRHNSNSDNDLSDQLQDVQHCSQTVEGSQVGCHPSLLIYDEQLLLARETARETPPLQDDVRKHSEYVYERSDDPLHKLEYNHVYRPSDLSTHNVSPHRTRSRTPWSLRAFLKNVGQCMSSLRLLSPSVIKNNLLHTFSEVSLCSSHTQSKELISPSSGSGYLDNSKPVKQLPVYNQDGQQPIVCYPSLEKASQLDPVSPDVSSFVCQSSYGLRVQLVEVESITKVGIHDFYDLNVPVEHHYFAEGAIHHNSGKSYVAAGWAIVNWMSMPQDTMVLVTSTSLGGARGRAWGAILILLDKVPNPPCKIRDSIGAVSYVNEQGKMFASRGIRIIAADKSKSKHQIGKMIGIKAHNLILIADEHSDISEAVQTVAVSNFNKNPHFQMISMSNPSSRFDPFGIFCTPKGGWDAVNVETEYFWETKIGGVYVRYDSMESPNFSLEPGEEPYDYLPTERSINETLESVSENREEALRSREFLRMDRAIFFDAEDDESVYTMPEIMRSGAMEQEVIAQGTLIAGLDPSFSSGGDGTVLSIGRVGYDVNGQYGIELLEQIALIADSTDKVNPINLQIADKVKNECEKRKILPENLAVDATGAGAAFCDILQLQWKSGFLRVQFGGVASDRVLRKFSELRGKDRFHNRASELFFLGKQYLLGRQLYGLNATICKQMVTRTYRTRRGTKGIIMQVEPKSEYRSRMGGSPDEADSYFVMLECARTRHSLIPEDPPESRKQGDNIALWKNKQRRSLRDYDAVNLGHDAHLD